MRLLRVFLKSMREQLRNYWMLIVSLSFAPMFVLLYWFITGGGTTSYHVIVINNDDLTSSSASSRVIQSMRELAYANGQPILKVTESTDRNKAESSLTNREAAALIIFPEGFSSVLQKAREKASTESPRITLVGDLTNPYYSIVSIMVYTCVEDFVTSELEQAPLIIVDEIALGASAARTEFEMYVPALLILSVVLLIFQVSMVIAREVESGTLRRLQMTNMTSFDFLAGVSLTQVLISGISVMLTFLVAVLLGFRSQGSFWLAILIGVLTSFSIVGVGLIIASLARTVSEAFIYANFPLIFLMFFTGAVFPIPPIPLFSIAGRSIGLADIFPPTHAITALNKVLTLGAGLKDILFELFALITLSIVYFALGIWLFKRVRMKAN